jgi:hypothetical protein
MTITIEYLGGGPDPLDVPAAGLTFTMGARGEVSEQLGRALIAQGLFSEVGTVQTSAPAPSTPAVAIPLLITKAMESDLRAAGFTTDEINAMTPQEAHDALGSKA